MITNDRIKELQQEYFAFCTELIKKNSPEVVNQEALMMRAFQLRDDLEKATILQEIDCKTQAIRNIEQEINKLKLGMDNQST